MRLFGLYKGHVYFIDTVSTAQGYCQYREITPIIGYNERGYTLPLNNVNMDLEPTPPPSWFNEMSPLFRGSHAVTVTAVGEVFVQNKWGVRFKDPRAVGIEVHLFEYKHGDIHIATNQWYSNENTIVNPFVSMIKYYNPEIIDAEFIEKIRFIEEMHEYVNVHSIPFAAFMRTMNEYQMGRPPEEILKEWTTTTINKPIAVVDINLNDIPEFNVAEIVYWNSWLKPKDDSKKDESKDDNSTAEKKPRLVEDLPPSTENVA